MEEHKKLYQKADELHDLIEESLKLCPPATASNLKEASRLVFFVMEELRQLVPQE